MDNGGFEMMFPSLLVPAGVWYHCILYSKSVGLKDPPGGSKPEPIPAIPELIAAPSGFTTTIHAAESEAAGPTLCALSRPGPVIQLVGFAYGGILVLLDCCASVLSYVLSSSCR